MQQAVIFFFMEVNILNAATAVTATEIKKIKLLTFKSS